MSKLEEEFKGVDIRQFIEEQIAKKDRYVSIYVGEYGTSISVYPLSEDDSDDLK